MRHPRRQKTSKLALLRGELALERRIRNEALAMLRAVADMCLKPGPLSKRAVKKAVHLVDAPRRRK